jgi:hypothetical protein
MEKLSNLHLRNDWKVAQPGLANSGASGGNADGRMRIHADRVTEFSIAPDLGQLDPVTGQPGPRWANEYWYLEHGARPNASKFAYELKLWVPKEHVNSPQAIELDTQLQEDSIVFNMALQFRFKPSTDSSLRWFRHHGLPQWKDAVGVLYEAEKREWWERLFPEAWVPFEGDKWYFIRAEYERAFSNDVIFRKLVLRDTEYKIDAVLPAYHARDDRFHRTSGKSERQHYATNKYNTALQLDLNGNTPPTAYSVYVDAMNVEIG